MRVLSSEHVCSIGMSFFDECMLRSYGDFSNDRHDYPSIFLYFRRFTITHIGARTSCSVDQIRSRWLNRCNVQCHGLRWVHQQRLTFRRWPPYVPDICLTCLLHADYRLDATFAAGVKSHRLSLKQPCHHPKIWSYMTQEKTVLKFNEANSSTQLFGKKNDSTSLKRTASVNGRFARLDQCIRALHPRLFLDRWAISVRS